MTARFAPIWLTLPLALLLALAPAARAQVLEQYLPREIPGLDTARGVTVGSRLRPGYDPPGIRAGSFVIRPQLEESLGYDDNVFGTASHTGSAIVTTAPSLTIGSDWSRDRLGAAFGLVNRTYLDQPAQSRTDWTASVGGALTIGRDPLALVYSHLSLHQDRTQLDAIPSDQPIPYTVDDVRSFYTFTDGPWSVRPDAALTAWRFSQASILGQPVSQAYRDRTVFQTGLRVRYALGGIDAGVVVLRFIDTAYLHRQAGQPTQDSLGYELLAGIDHDFDGVWRARALAGIGVRSFAASQYAATVSPIAEAELIWNPSGLTTLTALLSRTIEDTSVEGTGSYTYTRARLTIDHEYLRDVLLTGFAGAQLAGFQPSGGSEVLWNLGAGVTWLINRTLRLSLTYDFSDRQSHGQSSSVSPDYTRSIALLRVRVAL